MGPKLVDHQNLDSQNPYWFDFDGLDVDGLNFDSQLFQAVNILIVSSCWIMFDEKVECYESRRIVFMILGRNVEEN